MALSLLLLTLAVETAQPAAHVVQLPFATDPAVRRAKLSRPVTTFEYTAPDAQIDLRRARPIERRAVKLAPMSVPPSYAIADEPNSDDRPRLEGLVTNDMATATSSRPRRGPHMAAGVGLRMTADDGVLMPEVGAAGTLGKALTRIAVEALDGK